MMAQKGASMSSDICQSSSGTQSPAPRPPPPTGPVRGWRKVEGLHSDDAGDGREHAQGKNQHQRHLLASRKIRGMDRLQGEGQEEDIGDDGEDGVGVPKRTLVETCTRHRGVPEMGNWAALGDARGGDGDCKCDKEAQQCEARGSEPALEEGSQVEEDNGDLDEVEADMVDDISDKGQLGRC